VAETAIYETLERLSNLLRAEEREAGAREKLQPVQLSILLYLARCNRYSNTPAAVTAYLGVTKGTASQSVMTLERRGFVEKSADPADGRVARLRLTEAGRRVVGEASPPRAIGEVLDALSPARSRTIEQALEELLRELLRARGGEGFGVCRTCRHFLREPGGFRCGLTQEQLEVPESLQICREHAAAGG